MPRKPILDHRGNPLRRAPSPSELAAALRLRYDAAQTSVETENHWSNADGLSAAAANSPEVRRKLRERARYERDNNSYLSGMAETLANDVIGTGPRLQLQPPPGRSSQSARDAHRRASDAFEEWTAAVGLAETLRTYREARCIDGEGFLFLRTNPELPTPVQLDLRDVEADQVATPDLYPETRPDAVDGIEFDRYGNPTYYHLLREHPGDQLAVGAWGDYDKIPAALALHWFKRRRPGQRRGIPEVTPALWLYAVLRRYTMATLSAAEIAALFGVLLKTTMAPDDETPAVKPFDTQELVRGTMAALPEGYDAVQFKPEHPTTQYDAFERAVIRQIARCLQIPRSVAAGDSADLNYSSGRLDHQVYHRMIGVDRYHLETAVLDRILLAWLAEARLSAPDLVSGVDLGPDPRLAIRLPRHAWRWDGFKHVDPQKESLAQAQRLANGTTTLDMECAEDGNDWRAVADQRREERDYHAALGIPYPGDAPAPAPAPDDAEDEPPADANASRFGLNGHAH